MIVITCECFNTNLAIAVGQAAFRVTVRREGPYAMKDAILYQEEVRSHYYPLQAVASVLKHLNEREYPIVDIPDPIYSKEMEGG